MDQNLPKAVQAELARAEELQHRLSGQTAQPVTPVQTEEPQEQPPQQQQQEEPPVEPVVPAVAQDAWEQKYNTLYGKYSAEVPRLYDHVKLLTTQLQSATQQIDELKKQTQAPATQQGQQQARLVTEEDEQAFGADLVDMIKRGARQEAQSMISTREAELMKQLQTMEQRLASLTQTQGVSLREQYDTKLAQAVSDWRTIDADQRWLQWLSQIDPLTGVMRQALLDDAYQKMDVQRTAAIFNTFKSLVGIGANQVQQTQNRRELERQVAPQTSRADVSQQTQTKFWSTSEIQRFYDDVRRRRYSEKEAARIESEINAAIAEGRITA